MFVRCVCRCVCIVYDPQKSGRGQVSVRAIRLKDTFINLFKEGKLTGVREAAAVPAGSSGRSSSHLRARAGQSLLQLSPCHDCLRDVYQPRASCLAEHPRLLLLHIRQHPWCETNKSQIHCLCTRLEFEFCTHVCLVSHPAAPAAAAGKELREAGVTWRDVFVEVPIKVHNNSLTQALIADINPAAGATAADLERLNLGSAPYISKTMTGLIDCLDDLVAEQQKVRGQDA